MNVDKFLIAERQPEFPEKFNRKLIPKPVKIKNGMLSNHVDRRVTDFSKLNSL